MTEQPEAPRIAVVGGGITGLAAAHKLVSSHPTLRVAVFESSSAAGGLIRTERRDGFLVEQGPDSFITNKPAAVALCDELGISEQLIPTNAEFRRSWVLHNGRPVPVPEGFMLMAPGNPAAILKTPVLSWGGKLRLLWERFVRQRADDTDESLEDFAVRRFGRETFERLIQPLVGGIYTADPRKLSLKATLPRFVEMERQFGSIIKAVMAEQRATRRNARSPRDTSGSGARYGLFATHRDGLGAIVDACLTALRNSSRVDIQYSAPVDSLRPTDDVAGGWHLRLRGESVAQVFDAVIVTLPAHGIVKLLPDPRFDALRSVLEQFEYASSAIVVSGHQLVDFDNPLDAFGLVIPETERRDILAVSFASRKFEGRAPAGAVLLRTFVGGAMHPELLETSDAELEATVSRELTALLGMRAEPQFMSTVRYNRAMPQYHIGHLDRVREVQSRAGQFKGLQLAGSAWHGVGLPDSIQSGRSAADTILQKLPVR